MAKMAEPQKSEKELYDECLQGSAKSISIAGTTHSSQKCVNWQLEAKVKQEEPDTGILCVRVRGGIGGEIRHSIPIIAHAACYLGLLQKETNSNNFRKFEIKNYDYGQSNKTSNISQGKQDS